MPEKNSLLRHFLATLAYRTDKALDGAPGDFGKFSAGQGVRTPCELIRHMTDLVGWTAARFSGEEWENGSPDSLSVERGRFETSLRELNHRMSSLDLDPDKTQRLLQGPLADAMTHAGQLALLRRLAGSPLPRENFYKATIDKTDLDEGSDAQVDSR